MTNMSKNFWLLKTEPTCWSWTQQVAMGVTSWDDVRNFQAQKYLRQMKVEDEAFFYHTGNERRIMGVVEVIREAYPDPTDPSGRLIMVDVKTITSLQHPISLAQIKAEPFLAHLPLLRQSRLSVMPIDSSSWSFIKKWGGL